MTAAVPRNCLKFECTNSIPPALTGFQLCLQHFLDEAFVRSDQALGRCREGRWVDPGCLEWLLSDALAVIKNLEEGADEPQPEQRDRMLELLLLLANLHEYVAHHSIRIEPITSLR